MAVFETILLAIGIATIVSAIDFISKTTSNLTHSAGIPEYLAGTIILSFVISIPAMLILLFSNVYDVPLFGISVLIGFAVTAITLVMGIFLYHNKVSLVYEGHRNATFMWTAALVFFIVSVDNFIDRMDGVFLLAIFTFYVLYVLYRTSTSKKYVFLKKKKARLVLYPLSIFAIIISSFLVLSASINLDNILNISYILFGMAFIGPLLALPILDVIRNVFRDPTLTFDNMMGNIVVGLTLVPGIIAVLTPIPLINSNLDMIPMLILNGVCLSFAMLTRLRKSIHRKTGIMLILAFIFYIIYVLINY